MAVANPLYLMDLASEVLAGAVASLQDSGLSVPARRFVSPGAIADDVWGDECRQMAVQLNRMFPGLPGAEITAPENCGYPRTAEFFLRITQCVRTMDDQGNAPTVDELENDATEIYRMAWTLHQNLVERYSEGAFLESCQNLAVGPLVPFGPQGGVGGWQLVLQVQVSGA